MMTGFDAKAADQVFWVSNGGKPAPVSFDTATADEALAADTQAMLTLNAHEAVGKSPDQVAHAARLSRSTGAPIGAVLADMSRFEAMDTEKQFQSAPEATRAFLTNPVNAALAKDDAENLARLENVLQWPVVAMGYMTASPGAGRFSMAGDVVAGVYGLAAGAAGAFRGAFDVASMPFDAVGLESNPARWVSDWAAEMARRNVADAERLSSPQSGVVAGGVSSGVQSLVQTVPALAMALTPGGQAAALELLGVITGGDSYQQAREQGIDPAVAIPYAASQGVIEFVTEKIPVGRLIADINRGTTLVKTALRQIVPEVLGEQIATALQDLNDWAIFNPERTIRDYLSDRPEAAVQTLIATLIAVSGNVAVAQGIKQIVGPVAEAQQATAAAQNLSEAAAAIQESKLAARDPESMAAFIRQADGKGPLHVSARNLSELYQSGVIDQATLDALDVTEQLPEAMAAGGDVRISLDKYLMAVARMTPDARFQMLSNTRIEADGMTAAEAEAFLSNTPAQDRDAGDPSKLKGREAPHREFDAQEEIMRGGDPFLDPVYDEHVRREIGLLAEGVARDGAKGAELERVVYGRVLPDQIEILEKHGLSREKLAAAPRSIQVDGVGHALKKHGLDSIPLRPSDLSLVPDVVRTGEFVEVKPTDSGLPGIVWRKEVHGSWLYVVEEVMGVQRQSLWFKTAWRVPSPKRKG